MTPIPELGLFASGFWYMFIMFAQFPFYFMMTYLPFLWFLSVFRETRERWV